MIEKKDNKPPLPKALFLGIDKISRSIFSGKTESKKKELELLLSDKYSLNLWDELGTCVASYDQPI